MAHRVCEHSPITVNIVTPLRLKPCMKSPATLWLISAILLFNFYKKEISKMKNLEKIKEILKGSYFDFNSLHYQDDGKPSIFVFKNCLIAEPLTIESKRELQKNPYVRTLHSREHFYALFYFPLPILPKEKKEENLKNPKFTKKYRTRLQNLEKARDSKNINLLIGIEGLTTEEWLQMEYTDTKPYNKETDFKDDENDTTCKTLVKPQTTYQEIKRVNLNSNTLLILDNAKENKNKALFYYLQKGIGTNTFYNDCIINYILEHSNLLDPEYFNSFENAEFYNKDLEKFEKRIKEKEVRIPARELFKLYPHKAFKLTTPEGVTISNITRPTSKSETKTKRISKNDTLSFIFTDEFLNKYRNIIKKSADNVSNPQSFIKVPVFFVLQALKQDNLSSAGFKFLLWFLTFYRMPNPKIFHTVGKILEETGADLNHGYKKPLATLNKYFKYLHSVNALAIPTFTDFKVEDLNKPPEYDERYIQIKKPKITANKKN